MKQPVKITKLRKKEYVAIMKNTPPSQTV